MAEWQVIVLFYILVGLLFYQAVMRMDEDNLQDVWLNSPPMTREQIAAMLALLWPLAVALAAFDYLRK